MLTLLTRRYLMYVFLEMIERALSSMGAMMIILSR